MKTRRCVVFIFNGFADWEPSLVVSGLNRYSDFSVETLSTDENPVTSMGGFTLKPDFKLQDLNHKAIDLLVLPGGEAWEKNGNEEIIPLLETLQNSSTTIAAICAATTILARQGFLDNIAHTSNGLEYLKKLSPGYKGSNHYLNQPSVTSGKVITANGAGFIEFTHQIFTTFKIIEEPFLEAWLDLYKSGGMVNKF